MSLQVMNYDRRSRQSGVRSNGCTRRSPSCRRSAMTCMRRRTPTPSRTPPARTRRSYRASSSPSSRRTRSSRYVYKFLTISVSRSFSLFKKNSHVGSDFLAFVMDPGYISVWRCTNHMLIQPMLNFTPFKRHHNGHMGEHFQNRLTEACVQV